MITLDTNLKANAATTQYVDYAYNSLVKIGGKFFLAGDTGLFEVTGSSAFEETVTAYFEIPTMDFNISNAKRLRAVYIGYEADGNLVLTISTELGLSDVYSIPATSAGQHARRIMISRKLKGRYWTFQIKGVGIRFSVDEISVLPIVRGHGFDSN